MRESKSFTAEEALAKNLIDYIAKDENDLFRAAGRQDNYPL